MLGKGKKELIYGGEGGKVIVVRPKGCSEIVSIILQAPSRQQLLRASPAAGDMGYALGWYCCIRS